MSTIYVTNHAILSSSPAKSLFLSLSLPSPLARLEGGDGEKGLGWKNSQQTNLPQHVKLTSYLVRKYMLVPSRLNHWIWLLFYFNIYYKGPYSMYCRLAFSGGIQCIYRRGCTTKQWLTGEVNKFQNRYGEGFISGGVHPLHTPPISVPGFKVSNDSNVKP